MRPVRFLLFALLLALTPLPVLAQTTAPPVAFGGMDAQAVITVSAAVVALTQLAKWAGIPDKVGPWAVLILAFLGVALWAFTQGQFSRADTFGYFSGWIAVATSAAGVFGFTRAAASAVTSAKPPPAGAAQNPTSP